MFEDTATDDSKNNNQNLGNGIYDDKESTVQSVDVELLTKNKEDKYEIAKLYQLDKDGKVAHDENGNIKTGTAVVSGTERAGTYKFDGVIPGYYYVRFKYGNGNKKLYLYQEMK